MKVNVGRDSCCSSGSSGVIYGHCYMTVLRGGSRELRDVKKKNLVVAGRVEVGMLGTVTDLL